MEKDNSLPTELDRSNDAERLSIVVFSQARKRWQTGPLLKRLMHLVDAPWPEDPDRGRGERLVRVASDVATSRGGTPGGTRGRRSPLGHGISGGPEDGARISAAVSAILSDGGSSNLVDAGPALRSLAVAMSPDLTRSSPNCAPWFASQHRLVAPAVVDVILGCELRRPTTASNFRVVAARREAFATELQAELQSKIFYEFDSLIDELDQDEQRRVCHELRTSTHALCSMLVAASCLLSAPGTMVGEFSSLLASAVLPPIGDRPVLSLSTQGILAVAVKNAMSHLLGLGVLDAPLYATRAFALLVCPDPANHPGVVDGAKEIAKDELKGGAKRLFTDWLRDTLDFDVVRARQSIEQLVEADSPGPADAEVGAES